ncbi:type I restriction endonuclease subunit R [Lacticaseibacillus casei]|uniref:type I restriction endonuclease subunit R n=1 Tax=Lacticaseibacillus casei TaxID=1582 RepID=UPI00237E6234|nr:type I restriction endonuclease subunit R [Lacticaseibacillus casei]MDE3283049.1 type I restriction endonuclease subunit R [Lacticaseibacillus casei]
MGTTLESTLEKRLIEQLTRGISQWTYRPELKTEEDLWRNFRQKLEQNNVAVLDGHPLTEQEFRQVQNQLQFGTFYEAAKWLAGENGVAKVQVQREDATLGTIRLEVVRREDVAGGTSSYEVVNQIEVPKVYSDYQNRRFDVSLLINGLPLIHIELKNADHSYMDAFRQIKKYLNDGMFSGIYSVVQIFVVSDPYHTRYIAPASGTKMNERFLTNWVDEQNQPVESLIDFTDQVLSIPQAHKMVMQYTVIDSLRKALILLRPYQIHAIERVREATKRQVSGYVWHTTGSGKTLTAYKVARNLLQIASIDKTIFIVDRIDLDQQTTSSFMAYAENDTIDIDETEHVRDLIKKLKSTDRTVIVTTIQKLNYVMRRYADKQGTRDYDRLTKLKIAFVVDECHRSVSPRKQWEINGFFHHALWYGFTGTPIFEQNARPEEGNLPRTTAQQYGDRLHEYTVKEAMHDGAVLGFQVQSVSTIPDDQFFELVASRTGRSIDEVAIMDPVEREKSLLPSDYLKEGHMWKVIEGIVNHSQNKLGLFKGRGNSYTALLTTSSIAQAQRYYRLFQKLRAGDAPFSISKKTKEQLPDFPKVAITYSVTENDIDSTLNQDEMRQSIRDYNDMFGTSYSLENINLYNANINDRLARKQARYLSREEQIDLVIVVDRLLTGFDAPCLSTLFIDRQPMQPQNIIQAFSRTNRIFDKAKQFGQIVIYQQPHTFEKKIEEALVLYSNGGENEVLAPEWKVAHTRLKKAASSLKKFQLVASGPPLSELSDAKLKQFAKAFQGFDKGLAAAQVYTEYDPDTIQEEIAIDENDIEAYTSVYNNVIDELKRRKQTDDGPEEDDLDIEYELETVRQDTINYDYIVNLIQAYVSDSRDEKPVVNKKRIEEISNYVDRLKKNNEKLGSLMEELWQKIQANPTKYQQQNVQTLLRNMKRETIQHLVGQVAEEWGADPEEALFYAENFDPKKESNPGEESLKRHMDYDSYKTHNANPVKKISYWREFKNAYSNLIQEEILPLNQD